MRHHGRVLVVDAANVMGSRPDGWWKDRAKAAATLCGQIAAAVEAGRLAAPVTVVVEGAARSGVPARDENGFRIVQAPGSGDDAIVSVAGAAAAAGDYVMVVTADRELRRRVEMIGCDVVGPRWLLDQL